MASVRELEDQLIAAHKAGLKDQAAQIAVQIQKMRTADAPIEPGNIDLNNRPIVKNEDGSFSTVKSMSFGEDGKEILIPMISPSGTTLTEKGAIELYRKTGQHLGKFRNSDAANKFAEQLHKQQEQQYTAQAQEPSWGDLPGNAYNQAKNVASAIGGAIQHPIEKGIPAAVGIAGAPARLASGLIDKLFPPGEPENQEQKVMKEQGGIAADALIDNVNQWIKDPKKKIITDPLGSAADISTLAMGGEGLALKAGLPAAAKAAGNVAKYSNPATLPVSLMEKAARIAQEAAKNRSVINQSGIRKPAFKEMSRVTPDVEAAKELQKSLGEDAATFNLGTEHHDIARTIMARNIKDTEAKQQLTDTAKQIISNSNPRLQKEAERIYDTTPMSKREAAIRAEMAAEKPEVADTYAGADRLKMDVKPIRDMLSQAKRKASNDVPLQTILKRFENTLYKPEQDAKGNYPQIDKAGELIRARDQLEDMISKHAKKDLTKSDESRLQLGLEQNPILADLHAQVTGYLNSDPDIAEAYQIMQAAKARKSAYDLGYKNIISDSTLNDLDPERFAERVPRMGDEERGDMARGYLRRLRGVAGIIDTDKAVSKEALDKITRQGNVDRMREAFGDEKTDATLRLAENETKKVTEARELLAKEKDSNTTSKNPIFKEPKTGLVRRSDIGMLGSAGLGLLSAYNGHPLPAIALAGLAGGITGHRMIKKGRYENVMSDLAKASAYQGPKLSNLLDAVQKYQTKIPKKKTKAIENALLALIQSGRLGGM